MPCRAFALFSPTISVPCHAQTASSKFVFTRWSSRVPAWKHPFVHALSIQQVSFERTIRTMPKARATGRFSPPSEFCECHGVSCGGAGTRCTPFPPPTRVATTPNAMKTAVCTPRPPTRHRSSPQNARKKHPAAIKASRMQHGTTRLSRNARRTAMAFINIPAPASPHARSRAARARCRCPSPPSARSSPHSRTGGAAT